ncbi:metallophosphatase [Lampropedia cohaerens]|uniref:Metallophosphatase n=1 Tax=Lampropedia cohaerens TaxID=1610491 RepID=A0A0U1Q1Z8_9BURK|nr:5'-nucleotidase C-terminal domain-containing protein [Lampropedia cohaerens]KKW68776.1 metallophosphatase [Lampropedia cohaerens]
MASFAPPFARLALCVCVVGLLAACGGSDDDTPLAEPLDLTILHINDHHSNLAGKSRSLLLDTGAAERAEISVSAAGFARVAQALRELDKQSDNVIKIHAGDALTGTLYFNRAGADGEADAALMNTVCFDTFTLGNHEFDKGDTGLKNFLDMLRGGPCETQVLSANVQFGANSALHPSRAPEYVKPSTVIERAGQRIGLVGLTIAGKTKTASSPDPDTQFEDELAAAQREIDRLSAEGINKIIVQSHIGYGYDLQLASQLRGVDVIVGGDSHTLLGPDSMRAYDIGSPAGPYPTQLTNADGDPVCVVQAWEYSQIVGELHVSFDEAGIVTACEGTPHVLIGEDFAHDDGRALTAGEFAAVQADVNASGFLRITSEDVQAAQTLAPFAEKLEVFNTTEVALVQEELCSRRVPGGPGSVDYSRSSESCNALGEVNARGGDIQQIAAQAYLEIAQDVYGGADISLQSGGGVRVPLLPGRVTAADAIAVLPFGNMLYSMEITGTEVKGMIEDGLDAVFRPNGSTGPYPYTGGLRFEVDATQPKGQRASALEVRNATTGLWEPLNPSKTYKLAVLSFNANGGDGYETLANVPAERVLDIGVLDSDVFFQYLQKQPADPGTGLPILRKLDADLYSTKRFIGPAAGE